MSMVLAVAVAACVGGLSASDIHLRIAESNRSADGPPPALRVAADPGADDPVPDWEVWAGAAGGYRPSTGAGGFSGRIGLLRRLSPVFRGELELGTGAFVPDQQMVSLIRLGLRAQWPTHRRLVPFLYAAFAHHHEVSFEDARRAPLGAAFGLSDNGEIHRSGLDLGAGLSLSLPRAPRGSNAVRVGLRASVVSLLGQGPPRSIDGLLFVGSTF